MNQHRTFTQNVFTVIELIDLISAFVYPKDLGGRIWLLFVLLYYNICSVIFADAACIGFE